MSPDDARLVGRVEALRLRAPRGGGGILWLRARCAELAYRLDRGVSRHAVHDEEVEGAPGQFRAWVEFPRSPRAFECLGRTRSIVLAALLLHLHDRLARRCLDDARALRASRVPPEDRERAEAAWELSHRHDEVRR